jgi:putative membrane protein
MHTAINAAIVVVALLHLYFLVLEMFFWTRPLGLRTFRLTPEFAQQSKGLAANQGLYNGFLAAGLLWAAAEGGWEGFYLKLFFLSCVIVAGIFGAVTVNRRIFVIQALPALIALVLVHLH